MTKLDRFEAKISPEPNTGCWLWTAHLDRQGYGRLFRSPGESDLAHRFAFTAFRGRIPAEMELDHLCRVRCCVNPAHLEPVTRHENNRRGTSPSSIASRQTMCVNGHQFDGSWFIPAKGGYRRTCRKCNAAAQRRRKQRMAAQKRKGE